MVIHNRIDEVAKDFIRDTEYVKENFSRIVEFKDMT